MTGNIMYQALVMIHAIAGITGLLAFWIPAIAKKGGKVHRSAGKVFLLAMLVVIITGVPLSLFLLTKTQWVSAVFLLYLAVLLGASTGGAWFALKLKHDQQRYYGSAYIAVAWLLLLSGATVSTLGYIFEVTLLLIFGLIGPFAAFDMFKRKRETTRPANWWLLEHFGGMIGGGIATHVAFGAFGLRQLWPAYASLEGWVGLLPWIAPVVVGVVATLLLERHYRRDIPHSQPEQA
jgi:hypothetical protein